MVDKPVKPYQDLQKEIMGLNKLHTNNQVELFKRIMSVLSGVKNSELLSKHPTLNMLGSLEDDTE